MATSTTNSKEMHTTEKSDASVMSISASKDLFTKDVQDIRDHIDNGSITKTIFQSFVDKVNAQLKAHQQQIESLTQTNNNKGTTNSSKSASNKQSAAAAASSPDAVDSAKLISESKLIASFSSLRGVSPKSKLHIEFYTDFLALVGQTKKDQNDKKCIIRYSQIERVLCVPHKNDEILLYIGLADKIDLKFRKGGIDTVMLNFEDVSGYDDDEDHISVSIANSTALPSTLKGSEESVFCRVLSEVSKLAIERNNKMLFSTVDDSKRKIFFMEPTIKFNKCQMYPLRSGLFVFPKPTRFIAQQRIKCYEFERTGQGLRYFDVDIHLTDTEPIVDDAKAMRKRKKDNTIQLTMVPNAEKPAMESYFAEMGIHCKREGQATPQRKLKGGKGAKKKQSENGKEQKEEEEDGDEDGADEGEGEDEDESSSDEEYNIEEDEDAYGNDDDDCSDSSGDDEEDDIDMAEIRDVIEAGKENAAECDNQKRSVRRKRKRAEMEQSAEKEAVPSVEAKAKSGSPRKRFKRNECGNTDGKVVSKTVAKKRKASKSPKKKKIEVIELSDSDVAEEKKKVASKSVKKSKKRKVSINLIDDDNEEKEKETAKESKSQPKIADLFKAK